LQIKHVNTLINSQSKIYIIWYGVFEKSEYTQGLFGRASAPPKTYLAPAPLVERLFWCRWSHFKKTFGKTVSPARGAEPEPSKQAPTIF
jgi:hypothetical protein